MTVTGAIASQRVEVVVLALAITGLILELVRRKRLMERYALLWLIAGGTVLVLALWKGLLTHLSHAVGIYYPPSTLFAIMFVFVLAMLMHFSLTISRLSDQNKMLAQRVALLEHEQQLTGRDPSVAFDPETDAELDPTTSDTL